MFFEITRELRIETQCLGLKDPTEGDTRELHP